MVSDFYDQFPYPGEPLVDGPPPGFNWRWSLDDVFSFCTGALPNYSIGKRKRRILDAGCGSGVSTDYLAFLNPGSEILAIDISKVALDIAVERLRRSGGDRKSEVSFKHSSLFDLETEGSFDFVNSIGVIHHLPDPLAGLKALSSLLRPGGIIHLFIYATSGRKHITSAHNFLKMMGITSDNIGLKLARKFLKSLPTCNPLRRDFEDRWEVECMSDINFADMYFHPREISYDFKRLMRLVDNSGLQFIGFSNPKVWNLDRFLAGELLERAKEMSFTQQLQLVEYLDPTISHFELFLSKDSLEKFEWKNDHDLLASTGRVSKCLWGWPGEIVYDSDMNQIKIDNNSLTFLNAIAQNPDIPFGLLPLDWDKSMIASIARDMQRRQLLLVKPS